MAQQDATSAGFAGLVRRAAKLPPHRALAKAVRYALRHAAVHRQRQSDLSAGTYMPPRAGMAWRSRLALGPDTVGPHWHAGLLQLGAAYCAHRFDVLGSGQVEFGYEDRGGDWLAGQVNASNLEAARAIWALIEDREYRPIDWQRDVRSGYRWRADRHFTEQPIPIDTGADVKVPWELGRLQHLPQLALCAILAKAGTPDFAAPGDYAREATNQLLDFLALNPPRFGVNWMCPMDVGIRIINVLMTVDLLHGAGLTPPQQVLDLVLRAAREHAEHIVAHLEWTERGRSNHYLANLVGLVWAAAYLPPDPRTDAMLAAAAGELLAEAERQFGTDGGNYEGSTNYHRLSGELVLFGVALLAGLTDDELARLDAAAPLEGPLRRAGRLQRYGATIVPPALLAKLQRAGELTRSVRRPDGRVMQVGDTDSGRLLKLDPIEDALDHSSFVASVGALFGAPSDSIEAQAVRALAKGKTFATPASVTVADHGDLDGVIAAIAALPEECRRHRRFERQGDGPWQRGAFPTFGLYVFRSESDFVAFRCAPPPSHSAPLGHTHDDNLSVEYIIAGQRRIDPGSYCYTSSLSTRDRYRSASAHDVVRADDWELATLGDDPFVIEHAGWATCIAWKPDGVAGEISAPRGRLWRALRVGPESVEIWDGVSPPNRLRPVSEPMPVASGYGSLQAQDHPQ